MGRLVEETKMVNDTGTLNELWAKLMIKELIHHGVRLFCISPGSQSTSLTAAAAKHPLAETHLHYDERGMSFHALGYAKASKRPVALIVTSGTAVANLLPAVMEAYYDQVPLILITADRPPELRDCGSNQTTDQVKIFEDFVRWQIDMPCPDAKISQSYIGTTIAQAVASATSSPAGPVHINYMLRKPFLPGADSPPLKFHQSMRSQHSAQTTFTSGQNILQPRDVEQLADELSEHEKGLILVSTAAPKSSLEPLYTLSRLLQWPIFPDVLSHTRSAGTGHGVVPYYDLILKALGANEDFAPDAILQIGDRFVSKKLFDWIASKKPKVHCHVASHIHSKDHTHSITHRIACDVNHFTKNFSEYLPGRAPSKWFQVWKELNDLTSHSLDAFFKEQKTLSEPLLFHHLASILTDSSGLFLSNSMPVRNADAFFCPKTPVGPTFCNRGLSGIDGNIASASGVARGLSKPVLAILGDLAFLHDINSLAQVKEVSLKALVINNDGGSIFSFLPIAERKEILCPFFTTPHGLDLKHAAPLFGLSYECPQTLEELQETLKHPASSLIEIQTPSTQNVEMHQEILQHLKEVQNCLKLTV